MVLWKRFIAWLLIAMMVLLKKNVKNSVKCVKVGNDMFANNGGNMSRFFYGLYLVLYTFKNAELKQKYER
jgi:hypothetical protein